jgi:hypothetical protein
MDILIVLKGKTNMGVQTWFNLSQLNQLNRLIQMTVSDWLSYQMNINREELWMAILNILSIPFRIKVLIITMKITRVLLNSNPSYHRLPQLLRSKQVQSVDPQTFRLQGVLYLFIDLRKEANITGTLMLEIVSHISLMAVQALPPVLKEVLTTTFMAHMKIA